MNDLPLRLARFRLDFTVTEAIRLHYFAGSQLRGAFGHAQKAIACMTRQKDCKACPLYRSCAHAEIFETPPPAGHRLQKFSQVPNPYVIEPPPLGQRVYPPGAVLSFHFVLMGQAQRHLPLVAHAWRRAFQRREGIGGGSAELAGVTYLPPQGDAQALLDGDELQSPALHDLLPAPTGQALRLRFTTPLRLQKEGGIQGHAMTARDLLMALARRYWLLAEFHQAATPAVDFKRLSKQAEAVGLHGELQWRDWTRYSSRQRQAMVLGGVVGTVELHGDLTPFAGLLAAGQWLHLGKNASFGLGQYALEPAGAPTSLPAMFPRVVAGKDAGAPASRGKAAVAPGRPPIPTRGYPS